MSVIQFARATFMITALSICTVSVLVQLQTKGFTDSITEMGASIVLVLISGQLKD